MLFVLLWSTGFVVARYGADDAGPLTFLTVRMAVAAGLLAVCAAVLRSPRPTRDDVRWMAITAIPLHAVYLGGVFVAIDLGLPSGVSALIAGMHPVLTSLLAGPLLGERLRRVQWLGVVLGVMGVLAVVVDRLRAGGAGITGGGVAAILVAVGGISAGTILQRRHGAAVPLLWGTAVQYAAATPVFALGAVVVERWELRVTATSALAFGWSVFVLSIGAVLLMLLLLQRQAASAVSSLFFLTPALSALEGAILFGERFGALAVIGLAVALTGVAITVRGGT